MLNHLFSPINFLHRSRYASSVKLFVLTLLLQFTFNLFADEPTAVQKWISQSAIPINQSDLNLGKLDQTLSRMSIVGLGEATHGQHEFFEFKRLLTMHLIKRHGFRLVAYEASVTRTIAANDYVAGKSLDLTAATRGLGMLIWHVHENSELLKALREWNQSAGPNDQVRLIGVDAQDMSAAQKRLIGFLPAGSQAMIERIQATSKRSQAALNELMAGRPAEWEGASKEIEQLGKDLAMLTPASPTTKEGLELCVLEFLRSMTIYASAGGRDEAMAELLLRQLKTAGPEAKCVLWAHNAHLQHSTLRYLGSEQLAMGGHLTKSLDDRYYAIGFAFGRGEFQANAKDSDGKWGFRRYKLSAAPNGSLDHMLSTAKIDSFLLDLRSAPQDEVIQQWLKAGQGQRWFGGYGVNDDCDQRTQDASTLLPTFPIEDFDGLLYVSETRAAEPIDPSLILPTP